MSPVRERHDAEDRDDDPSMGIVALVPDRHSAFSSCRRQALGFLYTIAPAVTIFSR
jgi:hypothetical protein